MEIKLEQSSSSYTANVAKTSQKVDVPANAQASEQAQAKKAGNIHDSAAVIAKKQLNQSILQASLDVSVSVGDQPMALLYKTAIEGVNKALEGQLGPDAIQHAYDDGLDVSPQATADRIVQMSTAFFGKYQENHPELSTEEAVDSFTKIISGGIDKGFKEARDILQGLNVLKGDIADNIDKTYDLVQKGLQAFVDSYKKPEQTGTDKSAPTAQ
ncbi:DUF5610 domain-containing protein [Candidatus Methylobacter oryzae]|uniref:DUF5610 domain-containing protein n=1 Tax=Candidatus Methylobacter oryzae TaxID=2497749 RepID=A0ABY3C6B3_9GAMM|nr:DUF5610 domain-containing protein [Candidatus Methylobacter oryzae]TRW90265.1 hypothetical protein EKO24_019715 [Candidatus Methylobacter oryzae]